MGELTINEVVIPRTIDAPDAADFLAAVAVRNAVEADGYGSADTEAEPTEMLFHYLDQHEPKRMFLARLDDDVVGRAVLETQPDAEVSMAWLFVQVMTQFRRRGFGTQLADLVEQLALDDGRTEFVTYAVSPLGAGERLAAPTGFGSVPLHNGEVQFLLGRGYRLEQVERGSRLDLPVTIDEPEPPAGYAVRQWTGRVPERWLDDMALLYTRMSTDAPTAGLEEPEDVWTAARLLEADDRAETLGRVSVTSAIEHLGSGRLVGFTDLLVPASPTVPVAQNDTIVLREHRGHGLGMVLKRANLVQLQRVAGGHPSIVTFNAEENRHMLDVNEALGFVPIGYEGAWKKSAR